MDPVRQLFNILVVCTALFVIIWILATNLIIRAARNPLVTIIMGFLLTTISWLAWIGLILLFQGFRFVEISPTALGILALAILIVMVSFFRPQNFMRSLLFILLGAWVFLVGVLAVIGLQAVDANYVELYAVAWVFACLIVSLILQLILKYAEHRLPPQPPQAPPPQI